MNSEQIGMDRWERIEALRERQKELRVRLRTDGLDPDGRDPVVIAELKDIADAFKAVGERP